MRSQWLPLSVLLAARMVSDIGYSLDFICLGIFVWVRTDSVPLVSMVGLSLYAGGIVGGRLSQRFGATWDRRQAMIIADLVRFVALLVLAVVPEGYQLACLFPAVLVIGAGRSVFEATFAAATPALAGPRTQLANSLSTGLKGGAQIAGMGLAIVAVPAIGFRGIFALDAATYLLSALTLLLLPLQTREVSEMSKMPVSYRRGDAWLALTAAGIASLVVIRGLDAFGSSSHHVGLPLLGSALDPANPAAVSGALWMAWAVGTMVGGFVLRPVLAGMIARSPTLVFYLATAMMSMGFIGIFWIDIWFLMLIAAGAGGLGDALSDVTFKQAVQGLPDEQRGGAFGLSHVVINAGFVAGLLVTSIAITPSWIGGWVLLLHGIPLVASLVWAAMTTREGTGRVVHDGVS